MDLNWIWFGLLIFVIIVDITTSSFTFSWLGLGFIPAFIAGYFVDYYTNMDCFNTRNYCNYIWIKGV